MTDYSDVFGQQTVPPAGSKYQSISLIADVISNWSYNYSGTGVVIGKINDLASTGVYSITLPDATQVSVGEDFLFKNNSAYTLTIKDNGGTQVAAIASGDATYLYLSSNATAAGVYKATTFGATISAPDASTLAGYGLQASGLTLETNSEIIFTSSSITIDDTYRGKLIVLTGSSAAAVRVTLPAVASLTNGYAVAVMNASVNTGGVDTVDASLIYGDRTNVGGSGTTSHLQPNESSWYVTDGTSWYMVGYGQSNIYQFTQTSVDITAGGTIDLAREEYENDFIELVGTPPSSVIVRFPLVVSNYYVYNDTSYAVTLSPISGSGTSVIIGSGDRINILCDGTNIVDANSQAGGITTINSSSAPATAASAGVTSEIRYDSNYIYVCIATNTWKRVALSTW